MSMLSTIDPEAIRLLDEAEWLWSDRDGAFVKARDPEKETIEQYRSHPSDLISYEELYNHGLTGRMLTAEREAGLQWLCGRLHG